MYINVPNILPGDFKFVLPSFPSTGPKNKPHQEFMEFTLQTSSGNAFAHAQGKGVGKGYGAGGEYTNTQCNGKGNINSPCEGTPHPVPEPASAMLLAGCMVAAVAVRKFRRKSA